MLQTPEESPHFQALKSFVGSVTNNKPKLRSRTPLITVLALIGMLGSGWAYHQSQPITEQQRVVLSSLVAKVAKQNEISTQKVWAKFHKRMGVTSVRQLKRWSYNSAVEYLGEI